MGNEFYKRYAEFEKKWLSTVNPEPPVEANTVEEARKLFNKYRNAMLDM